MASGQAAYDTSRNANPHQESKRGLPNLQCKAVGVKPGQRRRAEMRGGLRTLSRRGSGVRIPAPAPNPHGQPRKIHANNSIPAASLGVVSQRQER